MSALTITILGAILIVVGGGAFGVGTARLLWAEDLHRAQELHQIWDRTKAAMSSTIASQDEMITLLKARR